MKTFNLENVFSNEQTVYKSLTPRSGARLRADHTTFVTN